jgi:TRAP-type C4-dicarboxylate transport system permease large subunit
MISIVSLAFGLVTPPYGLCLLICCSIARLRLVDVLKDVCIMLLPMAGVLILLIFWPDMALLIPRVLEPDFMK